MGRAITDAERTERAAAGQVTPIVVVRGDLGG